MDLSGYQPWKFSSQILKNGNKLRLFQNQEGKLKYYNNSDNYGFFKFNSYFVVLLAQLFSTIVYMFVEVNKFLSRLRERVLILIFLGYDGFQSSDTVEMYDPKTNKWTTISQMKKHRSASGITAFNSMIYAAGGNILLYY